MHSHVYQVFLPSFLLPFPFRTGHLSQWCYWPHHTCNNEACF